jgi:hypothetical protein
MGPAGPTGTSAGATISAASLVSCTSATSCSCPVNTVMVTGGAACSATNQYLYQSYPSSTTTWTAACQVFQTGANVSAATINVTCVPSN